MSYFENCISLGWYCGVAATLGRLGLRNFSGPFDWYNSDFEPVITLIDNEFEDFFAKENLTQLHDRKRTFTDVKYGFMCFHDIKTSLENDYDVIHEKYMRRAARFMEALKQPTCLFRAIRSEKDIEYITNNREHIEEVIKKYNGQNKVIYLFNRELKKSSFPCEYYNLECDWSLDPYLIRTLFDNNQVLLSYCDKLLIPDKLKANKEYYYSLNSACAGEIYKKVHDKDLSVMTQIYHGLGTASGEGIFLWGYGKHGKALCRYLKENNAIINGIIDEDASKLECEDEILLTPDEMPCGSRVFIAIENDEVNTEIITKLKDISCQYLTYKDLVN